MCKSMLCELAFLARNWSGASYLRRILSGASLIMVAILVVSERFILRMTFIITI